MPTRWRRLRHDARVLILAVLLALPGVVVSLALLWSGTLGTGTRVALSAAILLLTAAGVAALHRHVVRPLGTLANMLAALREGDFSIRARIEDPRDPLALALLELNALEETLRDQRLGAVEATETLRKVLEEIDVAVLAFDHEERLRLVNHAGERLLGGSADRLLGRTAQELRLDDALRGVAPRTVELALPGGTGRWELRRSVVRQEGAPLRLLALSDLSRALREEERLAWKRIIRVLSHEINNSLAPITSIAGSLRGLLAGAALPGELSDDVRRGLDVVSARAEGLGRFMAAYARLARMPDPVLSPGDVGVVVRRVAELEQRHPVEVLEGPSLRVPMDADQVEQALINLVRNAVDASAEAGAQAPVLLRWTRRGGQVHILVEDEGPGLSGSENLFVPFYTTKPGGSGVGLVLARQVAEGHGGTLVLEARPERGVRARFTLPLEPEA